MGCNFSFWVLIIENGCENLYVCEIVFICYCWLFDELSWSKVVGCCGGGNFIIFCMLMQVVNFFLEIKQLNLSWFGIGFDNLEESRFKNLEGEEVDRQM